jgi:hypothetical protein
VISIIMFGISGLLVGGVIALVRQDAPKFRIGFVAVMAVVCAACGLAYLGES